MTDLVLRLFVRNIDNPEDPRVRSACGKLTGIVGIVCNLILFAAKLLIGTVSGAVSITADAVNNLSDASGSVITLVGFRIASKPADEHHPYGHARIEYFSGLIVAVVILVIGLELGRNSVRKILHPEEVLFSAALVIVLLLSIAVKLWMSVFFVRIGKRIQSSALIASGADSRNDVISTAAVLLSCIIGRLTDLHVDGWMGLAVAVLILISGFKIAKETLDPLIGAAPDPELVGKIAADLTAEPSVLGIHDLIIHDYGPGRRFASVHAEMDCRQDPLAAHEVLDSLERLCMERHRVALTIHYDPIVTDDEVLSETRSRVTELLHSIDPALSIHDFRMVRGSRHTNLIFDLVVPFGFPMSNAALKQELDRRLQTEDGPVYHTVIDFDEEAFNRNP